MAEVVMEFDITIAHTLRRSARSRRNISKFEPSENKPLPRRAFAVSLLAELVVVVPLVYYPPQVFVVEQACFQQQALGFPVEEHLVLLLDLLAVVEFEVVEVLPLVVVFVVLLPAELVVEFEVAVEFVASEV